MMLHAHTRIPFMGWLCAADSRILEYQSLKAGRFGLTCAKPFRQGDLPGSSF